MLAVGLLKVDINPNVVSSVKKYLALQFFFSFQKNSIYFF